MCSNRLGQVTVELMIIIGFVLIFFIPLLLISYFKVVELNEDLASIQAEVAVSRLANTIDSVGGTGVGSSILLETYLPPNSDLEFVSYDSGGEIVLTMQHSSGMMQSVANSWFVIDAIPSNVSGGGNYRFNVTAAEDGVSVVLQ